MRPPDGKLVVFILSFLALATAPALSYSSMLSMEHSLGFNGHFQLHRWTPVTVVMENRGRATTGNLEVLVTSGSEFLQDVHQKTYTLNAELPHNSRKVFAFTILINSFSHELIVRFRQNERILISDSINLRPHYNEKSFVVVADRKISPDFLYLLPETLYPVSMSPRHLPEDWYGFDSVQLLITTPGTLANLREKQFQALTQWVSQGGFVVVSSATNYGSLMEPRTRRFLPAEVLGHKQFVELESLERFCNQKLSAAAPFLVLNARVADADVLLEENGVAIIAEKKYGLGKIIFQSLNLNSPPFNRWSGMRGFWEKILSRQPSWKSEGIAIDNQNILGAMMSKMPAHFPNFKFILLFLAAYLFLMRFFKKRIEKYPAQRLRFSLYALGVIFLFSMIGFYVFFYPNHRKTLTYSSFSQLAVTGANRFSSGKSIIGIYALRGAGYDFNLGSQSFPVTHLLYEKSGRKKPFPYMVHEGPAGQRITGKLDRWTHSFYMTAANVEHPYAVQANLDKLHLSIIIENKSPHHIKDCLVYFKERFLFLGEIPAQSVAEKNIKLSELKRIEFFSHLQADSILNQMIANGSSSLLRTMQKSIMSNLLLGIHTKYQSKPESMYMVGWVQTGLLSINFKKSALQGEDLTLIGWEIPVGTT